VIPILDNKEELQAYKRSAKNTFRLGIRVAAEEEPNFPFYTSRLGIRAKDILEFYVDEILYPVQHKDGQICWQRSPLCYQTEASRPNHFLLERINRSSTIAAISTTQRRIFIFLY
jgi:hypothetical protein